MLYCVYAHENKTRAVQFFLPPVQSRPSLPASAPNLSNFYHEETRHLHTQKKFTKNRLGSLCHVACRVTGGGVNNEEISTPYQIVEPHSLL